MSSQSASKSIHRAAELIRNARHAVVFTGAGISTPSGIPDFRSQNTGLWERFDPMEVASIQVFQTRPEKFYDWLRPLLEDIWNAQPNPAHTALAELESAGMVKAVITQNIDDLHQRAGSQKVYEVHGSLRTLTCPECAQVMPSDQFRPQMEGTREMPRCPSCGKILKPDIVLYGEMLPVEIWSDAEEHCRKADVIVVAGSSLEVWPAASLPEVAVDHGAHLIINNLSPTYLDRMADIRIPLDVAQALPQIAALAKGG